MRELKFRAWTGKKMLYQDKQYLASFIRRIVPEIILDHGGEAFSLHESYLPNGGTIDEYLMQCTGLKDKHGKEVYEGDILKIHTLYSGNKTECVIFDLYAFMTSGGYFLHAFDECYEIEVIGNIYETPQLLKEGHH